MNSMPLYRQSYVILGVEKLWRVAAPRRPPLKWHSAMIRERGSAPKWGRHSTIIVSINLQPSVSYRSSLFAPNGATSA